MESKMKKRLSLQEQEELVRAFRDSGTSQIEFCKGRGVSTGTFRNYLKKSFVAIPVSLSKETTTEVEVTLADGTVVRIRS